MVQPDPILFFCYRAITLIVVCLHHFLGWTHPYPFNLRQPIPLFPLPLLREDEAPEVDLGTILHALYDRARFDLRLDYTQPSVPPLSDEDVVWAQQLLAKEEK